jgi:hypothetical protein
MTLHGLNIWGVIIAILVTFVSGGIWFGPKTFYPLWMKARGIESGQLTASQNKPAVLFGSTFVAIIIQVMVLGAIITSLQVHTPSIGAAGGAGIGFLIGLGIAAFNSLPHRLFGGENYKSWIIECSNDVLNLTIAGAIIAAFN